MRKTSRIFLLIFAFTAVSPRGSWPALMAERRPRQARAISLHYTTTLESNVLEAGDYFVIYDFFGYQPGSITAPNLNWTTDDTGTTGPYPGAPTADTRVVNLLWVYEGANISALGGPIALGNSRPFPVRTAVGVLSLAGITDGGNFDFFDTAAGPIPSLRRRVCWRQVSRRCGTEADAGPIKTLKPPGRDRGNMKSVECRSRPCPRALNKSETVPSRFTLR